MFKNLYDRKYFEQIHNVDQRERELIFKGNLGFLQLKKGNIRRILDVGCGLGEFLKHCDRVRIRTYGLDISRFAISLAKKNTIAHLKEWDVATQKWPFKDNFFDAVCAFDLLEHVRDSNFVIKEAIRVLNKSGMFLATTPNGELEKSKLLKKLLPIDPTHINVRGERYWKETLKKAGFKKIDVRGCLFFCFPPVPKFRAYLRTIGVKSLVKPIFFPIKSVCATLFLTATK